MTLEDWGKQDRNLSDQLKIIEGLCIALNEAHERREVHRALEPRNIEVTNDGTCDVSGAISGSPSPRYRAPELSEGSRPSPEADIYSAGVIFYEMLAGRTPSGERPTPLADLRPDVSRDLADAIMACLERGPDWRPKDLSYLLQVVGTLNNSGTRPAPRPAARGGQRTAEMPRPSAPRAAGPRFGTSHASSGPSRMPLYLLALVVLVGAGAGGWWYFTHGEAKPTAQVPLATPPPTTEAVAPVPPTVVAGGITPVPAPTASTRPEARPNPTPIAAATPGPAASVKPTVERPTPVRAEPTPVPVAIQDPVPTTLPATLPATPPPSAQPAVLTAVSPLTIKRGSQHLLDVRGIGLRPEHQARVVRIKETVSGISVVRQKWVDPTLIKVLVDVQAGANPGTYAVALVDARGTQTNGLTFTVGK